jgi:hypothetical protein
MVTSIREVVHIFREARSRIEETFGRESAKDIVSAVVQGEKPREGITASGEEYFVHGVGYTVVLPNGGQVHMDSSRDGGEIFSVYDMQLFFTTSLVELPPSVDVITRSCEELCMEGLLVKVEGGDYLLPR